MSAAPLVSLAKSKRVSAIEALLKQTPVVGDLVVRVKARGAMTVAAGQRRRAWR